ncbi:MAG: methyltransferase domain-containing protein [Hyphomicrobiales bacterium]
MNHTFQNIENKNTNPVMQLFDWLHAPIRFALLEWAIDEQIFEHCKTEMSCKAIATKTNFKPEKLVSLLNALVSMGLLEFKNGCYHSAPNFIAYLTQTSELCLLPTLKSLAKIRHAGLDQLSEFARGVAPQDEPPLFDAEHWGKSTKSLRAFHKACAVEAQFSALKTVPYWDDVETILDLGAGSDILAQAIIAECPDKHVSLFDVAPAAEQIRPYIADVENISVMAGDYNVGLPNQNFDLIWASMSLYFVKNDLVDFFKKLKNMLNENGCFVSFHEALDCHKTAPEEHVVGRLIPTLKNRNYSFERGDIRQAALKAGFIHHSSRSIETAFGPFELDILMVNPASNKN